MRFGSSRTKEKRVSLAISRGMLAKQKNESDLRTINIMTTGNLEHHLINHFSRTLNNFLNLSQRLHERQMDVLN